MLNRRANTAIVDYCVTAEIIETLAFNQRRVESVNLPAEAQSFAVVAGNRTYNTRGNGYFDFPTSLEYLPASRSSIRNRRAA
jgi:hypothetical protein